MDRKCSRQASGWANTVPESKDLFVRRAFVTPDRFNESGYFIDRIVVPEILQCHPVRPFSYCLVCMEDKVVFHQILNNFSVGARDRHSDYDFGHPGSTQKSVATKHTLAVHVGRRLFIYSALKVLSAIQQNWVSVSSFQGRGPGTALPIHCSVSPTLVAGYLLLILSPPRRPQIYGPEQPTTIVSLSEIGNTLKIIPDNRFGFRREHATLHQLARVVCQISGNMARRKVTAMILLDSENAFDAVSIEGLLYKLKTYKIPDSLIKLVSSFLTDRQIREYMEKLTDTFKLSLVGHPNILTRNTDHVTAYVGSNQKKFRGPQINSDLSECKTYASSRTLAQFLNRYCGLSSIPQYCFHTLFVDARESNPPTVNASVQHAFLFSSDHTAGIVSCRL
ncbi:hypothetical protein AAG570_008412 [Ranatra chinensis]|uniref:Reverse transcriptase domain-containing protein n=1 Tax=Ranatra chinensis TaxID=642074 RepID=A0ABD0YQU6_9HEMI